MTREVPDFKILNKNGPACLVDDKLEQHLSSGGNIFAFILDRMLGLLIDRSSPRTLGLAILVFSR